VRFVAVDLPGANDLTGIIALVTSVAPDAEL
jgi:hypothetical protein